MSKRSVRPDAEQRSSPRPRLAMPEIVGALLGALVTGLPMALDVLRLPAVLDVTLVMLTSVAGALLGWTAQGRPDRPREVQPAPGSNVTAEPPAQLPPVIAHFTGRSAVLKELSGFFADAAPRRWPLPRGDVRTAPLVVSVHGPAGVGKSALVTWFARKIAGHYPDGQLYFNLRGAGESRVRPEDVLTGFLLALGVRLTTDPGGLHGLQKIWWTRVRGRRILIYLDNAHDAEQVQALIPPEPGCTVLVTSRQPLYLFNTKDLRLGEFSEAHGIELLGRLAGKDRVSSDSESATEVVRLCGHLPLAISICGGRLAAKRHWTMREMAIRLADERRRLDELQLAKTIDKSVRASLQLSYVDCTKTQRRLLRSFSLLTTPDVPSWVADELLGAPQREGGVRLEELVDAQLVEYSVTDATGATRYRLHDLVRLYARERAEEEDAESDRHAAIERVLGGYRGRAEQVAAARWPQDWHRQRDTPGQRTGSPTTTSDNPSAMEWLTSERMALLALLGQANELRWWEPVWRLGRAVCSLFHSVRVFWQEWREVAELTCMAAEQLADSHAVGVALLERAAAVGSQGQTVQARDDALEALRIFEGSGERWWAARAMRTVGITLRDAGNLDEGQHYLVRAIEVFSAESDAWWQARTQRNLGELRLAQRRYEEGRELLEQALEVFRSNGNNYSETQTRRAYGELLAEEGRYLLGEGARGAAEAKLTFAALTLEWAAERFRLRHEQWEEARCLRAAGEVGDPRNGLRELTFVRQAEDMLEGLGDSWGVARTQLSEARALARLDRYDEAINVLRQTGDQFHELGDRWWEARCLRTRAEVLLETNRATDAREPAAQALAIYTSLGNEAGVRRARDVLDRTRRGELS